MKKILVILVLIIASFSLIQSVQATSGACSYHGGVSCGAGPDWDGSAICNDGWRDSSVSYLSSNECVDYVSCTKSELETLYEKYNVHNLKSQKTNIQSQINIIYTELNAALVNVEGKPITMQSIYAEKQRLVRDANSKILPLQAQLDLVNSQLPSALDSVIRECTALGIVKINKLQQQSYASKLAQEQTLKEDREKELQKLLQTQCTVNSTLKDDGKCYCNSGYTLNNDRTSCVKNNDTEKNEQTVLKTYISTKQRINIRKSPSSSTKILSITTPNKKYEMLSQNKDWVEVRLEKTNGWIMKKYVKFQ